MRETPDTCCPHFYSYFGVVFTERDTMVYLTFPPPFNKAADMNDNQNPQRYIYIGNMFYISSYQQLLLAR